MTKRAEIVSKVFELLWDACDIIKSNDQCSKCPRKYMCLEGKDYSLIEYADLMSADAWDEFIEFADKCIPSEALEELMQDAHEHDKWRDEQEEGKN